MKRIISSLTIALLTLTMVSRLHPDAGECSNQFTTTSLPAPASVDVGVILVQFSDWQTNTDARGSRCHEHLQDNHYTYQEFSQHLFSQDSYESPSIRTHDEEDVFGSLRDYFNENSYDNFDVTGEIFNDTTGAGIPNWVTLSETKQTWFNRSFNPQRLLDSTEAASGFDTSEFDKIILIYAGQEMGGGLNPSASGVGGFVYQGWRKNPICTGPHPDRGHLLRHRHPCSRIWSSHRFAGSQIAR